MEYLGDISGLFGVDFLSKQQFMLKIGVKRIVFPDLCIAPVFNLFDSHLSLIACLLIFTGDLSHFTKRPTGFTFVGYEALLRFAELVDFFANLVKFGLFRIEVGSVVLDGCIIINVLLCEFYLTFFVGLGIV